MIRNKDGSIEIIGHSQELSYLRSGGLGNTLLIGPESIGKRSILESLIETHSVEEVFRVYDASKADLEEIRKLTLEKAGSVRVVLMRLTYAMTQKNREKLLKVIEDSPEGIVFLATSTYDPGLALTTRFTTHKLKSLHNFEVATILEKLGYAAPKASTLSNLGLGTIRATTYADKTSEFVFLAKQALKYIEERDEDAMDAMYAKWDDGNTRMLTEWARERITERWRVYKETDFPALSKGVAMRILKSVDYYDRPRYVVRNSLVSIVRDMNR